MLSLKPHFVLEHGSLSLIPIPAPARDQALILTEHFKLILTHDIFSRGKILGSGA